MTPDQSTIDQLREENAEYKRWFDGEGAESQATFFARTNGEIARLRAELAEVRGKLLEAERDKRFTELGKFMLDCVAALSDAKIEDGAGRDEAINAYIEAHGRLRRRAEAAEQRLATLEGPAGDEPITEEWLRSVGFTSNHGVCWLYDMLIEQRDGWEIFIRLDESHEWELQLMQSPIGNVESRGLHVPTAKLRTRGDVLRLMAALGIEAQERK